MLPLRGAWWAVRLESNSAPAGMQTREDCHRWSPVLTHACCSFPKLQLELPAPWGTLQPSGSRSGLRETLSGPNGRVGAPPCAPPWGAALSCILYFFQPPGGVPGTQPLLPNSMDPTRQQGRGGRVGPWRMGGVGRGSSSPTVCLSFLPLTLTPPLSHRSPQHGRINAENEPSSRNGAHGARPTGNQPPVCPSISLAICMHLPSLLWPSLSVFPRPVDHKVRGEGMTSAPAALSACRWAAPQQS